jgi:hypothetical protein
VCESQSPGVLYGCAKRYALTLHPFTPTLLYKPYLSNQCSGLALPTRVEEIAQGARHSPDSCAIHGA